MECRRKRSRFRRGNFCANRAVIFDSHRFHETGTIRFKDVYLKWRINVTMP
jgi:hypothetical protein